MSVRAVGRFLLVTLLALVALTVVDVASAGAESPCPPGQPPGRPPGRPGGTGQPPGRPPQYPPGKCQLRLSQSSAAAGESVTVGGDGFVSGASVDIALEGRTIASATADSTGSFTTRVTIPADVQAGSYTMSATGPADGGPQVLSAAFDVTPSGGTSRAASSARAPSGELPRTGTSSNSTGLVVGAGGLIVLGALFVVVARKRANIGDRE